MLPRNHEASSKSRALRQHLKLQRMENLISRILNFLFFAAAAAAKWTICDVILCLPWLLRMLV